MAANPPLDEATEDPICLENEQLLVRREGITFAGTVNGERLRLRGFAVLSNLRIVFVSKEPSAIYAIDLPLANTREERFNQPIFGANNITGVTAPISGGNLRAEIAWTLEFREGGVGTWLPWFFTSLKVMRRHLEQQAAAGSPAPPPMPSAGSMRHAFVDPADPSKLYVSCE